MEKEMKTSDEKKVNDFKAEMNKVQEVINLMKQIEGKTDELLKEASCPALAMLGLALNSSVSNIMSKIRLVLERDPEFQDVKKKHEAEQAAEA